MITASICDSSDSFEQKEFIIGEDNRDLIMVKERKNKTNCYIASKGQYTDCFKSFVLFNGPQVNIKCDIRFDLVQETGKYIPRLTFKKTKKDGEEKTTTSESINIEFNNSKKASNFRSLINFLKEFKNLVDTGKFNKTYQVSEKKDSEDSCLNDDEKKRIMQLFHTGSFDSNFIQSIIENGITNEDAVAMGYRKKQLEIFDKLLSEPGFIDEYKTQEKLTCDEEKTYQHFFQQNKWIFGYGLDYRFIDSSIREVEMGYGNIDFASFHRFSVLVEIKTPTTTLMKSAKSKKGEEASPNRVDAWSLSSKLIDGVSQILAYKANRQLKFDSRENRENYGESHITADPKAILVIGKLSDLTKGIIEQKNRRIIQETFELFRRDSRNIDIVTYDELYERAYFIVHNELPGNNS